MVRKRWFQVSTGGILDASYPGQLPRNEQQISNFKRRVPISTGQKLSGQCESNELYSIMLQAHLEDGSLLEMSEGTPSKAFESGRFQHGVNCVRISL